MSAVPVLFFSALCGIAFGYAAQRGSLCVISGIETLLEGRSPRVFLSFLRCSVWVIAVTLPLAWAIDGNQLDGLALPIAQTLAGGLLFGVGAAINGGCSFGTLIRLGAGDVSFLATLAGLGFGILIDMRTSGWNAARTLVGPSPLEQPGVIGVAVLLAAVAICARELFHDRRRARHPLLWPPERAALLMGAAGGILYALNGSWAYTVAIERGLSEMAQEGIPNLDLALIFFACVLGAGLAARTQGTFAFRLRLRDVAKRLLGGTIMGIAATMIPGGNDVLILHALPALSPHAPVAYIALVAGAATALALSSRLRRSAVLPG